jgi:response regulator RpfG family c-di-GMP phosphodiesterase
MERANLMSAGKSCRDLDEIIASQTDTTANTGKLVVLAVSQDDERRAFADLLDEMGLRVKYASCGAEALRLLEDHPVDLLVSEFQLPDMHVWQLLGKAKEIQHLREIPTMVITDQPELATMIARVDFLARPVSIARLRHNISMALAPPYSGGKSPS